MLGKQQEPIPPEDLAANVARNLRTANEVLRHLEKSLVQAGFVAGADSYVAMTNTLLGQRLWSVELENPDIEQGFAELAATASKVHMTLLPYVKIMGKLSAVAEPKRSLEGVLNPEEAEVLAAIQRHRNGMSITRLQSETGVKGKPLAEILARLQEENLIERYKAGARLLFRAL